MLEYQLTQETEKKIFLRQLLLETSPSISWWFVLDLAPRIEVKN